MDSLLEFLPANHLQLGALIAGVVAVLAGFSTFLWNSFQLRASMRRERLMKEEQRASCDQLLAQSRALMGAVDVDGKLSHYRAVSKDDLRKARQLIDEACAKAPDYAWGHYISGCYYITTKAPAAGIKSLKRAVKLEPKSAIYTNALSIVLQQRISQQVALRDDASQATASARFFLSNLFVLLHAIRYGRKTVRLDRGFYAGMLNYVKLLGSIRMASKVFHAALDRSIHFYCQRAIAIEPSKPQAYVVYGSFLLACNNGDKAKKLASQGELRCPDSADVLRLMLRIYVLENNASLAREYERKLDELEGLTRDKAADNIALGLLSFKSSHEQDRAANHYVAAHLKNLDELTENAVNDLIHERWQLAREQFAARSENDSDQAIYQLALAECALELEDHESAANHLDTALSLDPDLDLAYAMRSQLFARQARFSEAMNAARQALTISPDYTWALQLYLDTSIRSDRVEEAAAEFDENYFINSGDTEALLMGASFFIETEKFDSARRLLQAARSQHGANAEFYLCLCRYHLAQQNYPAVLDNAQLALHAGAKPEQCDFYCVLANKETGNLNAAAELINRCIEADDGNSSYYYQRARIFRAVHKNIEAEQDLQRAIELNPLWLSPLFELGDLYSDSQRFPQAVEQFLHAQKLAPGNAYCQFKLGFCYENCAESAKAIQHYQKAIDLGDDDPSTVFNLGALVDGDGEHERAKALYQKALKRDPDYAPAHFNLACLAWQRGEREQALAGFKLAHKHRPSDLTYLERLANVLHSMGRYEESIQFANHLLELDPEHYRGYEYMGLSQEALQQYDEAIASFQAAARLSISRRAEFMNRQGDVYLEMGKLAEAEGIYKTIVKQFPENHVAVMNLGTVCLRRDEPEQAIDYYTRSIAMDDTYPLAYSNRAFVYYRQGEADKAVADMKRVIALDEKNASTYNDIGAIYARGKQDHRTAVDYYQQALAIAPDSLYPLTNMGEAYVALSRFDDAVPYLLRALEIDSQHLPIYEHLLKAYEALNDRDSYHSTWATLCAFEAEDAKQLVARLSLPTATQVQITP